MPLEWRGLREQARAAEHDEGELRFLRGELERLGEVREARSRALRDEARDVKQLERFSLTGWVLRMLGEGEEELAKERREWVEAGLQLDQTRGEIAELEARARALEAEAQDREQAQRRLAEAFALPDGET
jgi:hypothetical protein